MEILLLVALIFGFGIRYFCTTSQSIIILLMGYITYNLLAALRNGSFYRQVLHMDDVSCKKIQKQNVAMFSCSTNSRLTGRICEHLGIEHSQVSITPIIWCITTFKEFEKLGHFTNWKRYTFSKTVTMKMFNKIVHRWRQQNSAMEKHSSISAKTSRVNASTLFRQVSVGPSMIIW